MGKATYPVLLEMAHTVDESAVYCERLDAITTNSIRHQEYSKQYFGPSRRGPTKAASEDCRQRRALFQEKIAAKDALFREKTEAQFQDIRRLKRRAIW
ncbi:MAG: hypothetical protein R3F37_13735 [Candidatus Competibacteraceae bacterium]